LIAVLQLVGNRVEVNHWRPPWLVVSASTIASSTALHVVPASDQSSCVSSQSGHRMPSLTATTPRFRCNCQSMLLDRNLFAYWLRACTWEYLKPHSVRGGTRTLFECGLLRRLVRSVSPQTHRCDIIPLASVVSVHRLE
jgi:hypothetical protein